jgi:hypothetical protein
MTTDSASPMPILAVEKDPYTVLVVCADDESKASQKWRKYVSSPVPDEARVLYVGINLTPSEDAFRMDAKDYASDSTTPSADLIVFEFCPIGGEHLLDSRVSFRREMTDLVDKKLKDDGKVVLTHKKVYFMAKRLNMIPTAYPHTFTRPEHIIL